MILKSIFKFIFIFFIFFFVFHFASAGGTISTLNTGLVGYYKFDEGVGTVITDSSGNRNHGRMVSMANPPTATSGWESGKFGKGLKFDGTDDYVNMGDVFDFERTNSFSISAWIKTGADGVLMMIASKLDSTSPYPGFQFFVDTSAAGDLLYVDLISSVSLGNYIEVKGSTDINDGKWHNVAMVYSGTSAASGIKIYVDGVQESMATVVDSLSASILNNINFEIGARDGADYSFNGSIDEARVYNRALLAAEVKKLYSMGAPKFNASQNKKLTTGLAGYWSFDGADIADVTVFDRSGGGNHGTLNNGPIRVLGKKGQALKFDGSNDFINVPHNTSLNASDVAIQAWIKPAISGVNNILRKGTSSGVANYNMYLSSRYLGFNFYNGAWNSHTDTTTLLPLNEWSHVAAVYSDSLNRVILYVNGNQVLSEAETASLATNNEAVQIGVSEGVQYFPGAIDEVRIYNRALSADEVKRLYNMAASKFNAPQTKKLTDGLVGYWTFDGKDVDNNKIYDRSGNNNYGYYSGNSTSSAKTIGKIGQAFKFDGVDDHIAVLYSSTLNLSNNGGTISAWIKLNRKNIGQDRSWPLFWKQYHSNIGNSHGLRIGPYQGPAAGPIYIRTTIGDGTTLQSVTSSQTPILNGTWYFVAMKWASTTVNLYVNNILDKTDVKTVSLQWPNNVGSFIARFGNSYGPGGGFIDEVRVYNRELSDNEIKRLYNMGR